MGLGPSVVALAAIFANRRDKLVDKVNDLAERVSRIEGILLEQNKK